MWSDVWPAMDGVVCLSILLEGRVTVLNNFTKRRQNGSKIGTRDKGRFPFSQNSENSGLGLNEKRFFRSPDWKILRKSGTAQKVVLFSRWKLPNGKFVFHLQISRLYCFYHQFQTFRGLLTGQPSLGFLEWNLWQMERVLPNGNSQ